MRYLLLIVTLFSTVSLGQSLERKRDLFRNINLDTQELDETFSRVSQELDVPENLLRAICWSESKYNLEAYNHGDGTGSNHAFGICQVLHSTARGLGFKDDNCFKDFSDKIDPKSGKLRKTPRTFRSCKMFGAYTNIYYAGKYLKSKLDQYDGSWISAIATYNSGSLFICRTGVVRRIKDKSIIGKCKIGKLLNSEYVDRVLKALEEGR